MLYVTRAGVRHPEHRDLIAHKLSSVVGGVTLCRRSVCDGAPEPGTFLSVRFEHVGEAKALTARLAGIGLLARVSAPVPLHVGPAGEALPADLADVRLFT